MNIDPKLKDAYERVVLAGLKALYGEKTRAILMKGLAAKGDIAEIVAREVAGLVKLLDDRSGMKIPKQILIPAAVTLMLDVFKFVEDAGKAEITEEVVSRGMQLISQLLIEEYKAMGSMQQGQLPPQTGQPAQSPQGMPAGQPMPQRMPAQPMGLMGSVA